MKFPTLLVIAVFMVIVGCKKDNNAPAKQDVFNENVVAGYRSNPSSAAYYIDSNIGDDKNDGSTPQKAWKTLDRLHKVVLKPGNVVRIARGSVFQYQNLFFDNGSAGAEGNPIIIEAYGEGNLPVITEPRALWDKSKSFSGIVLSSGSSYFNILDIKVENSGSDCGVYLSKESHHITIAGNEVYRCGTGIAVDGHNQKVIGNIIHETGYGGKGSGIGIGFAGSDLELAWNSLSHCIVTMNDGSKDGSPFEYYGRRSDSDYDLSNNISIHHNTVNDCLNFIETYGNATNMIIAYNVYKNSTASPFQFHLDDCEHPVWTHECTYEVRIENNTMVMNQEPIDGGWGVVGLLVDWNHLPDPAKSKFTVRNNLFVTNHTILSWINPLGNNLIHDHNVFYFLGKGSLSTNKDVWTLDVTEKIADPKFADMNNDNFRLTTQSPAINAGMNSAYSYDILGNATSITGACDAGAYKYVE